MNFALMATNKTVMQTNDTVNEASAAADALRWRAVVERNPAADGQFYYGVQSTRIYCRPICPSRRPRPDRVQFFADADEAKRAGFRACHRCQPDQEKTLTAAWLAGARSYLEAHDGRTVPLAELARRTGVTVSHLQKAFQKAYGVSPREFQQARRAKALTAKLSASSNVTDAIYSAGFGSAGAGYAASKRALAMRPKAMRDGAVEEHIVYDVVATPLGKLVAAATARGLCMVAFADTSTALSNELKLLRARFHAAELRSLDDSLSPAHRTAAETLKSALPRLVSLASGKQAESVPVDLRGTVFQQRVWKALQRIPRGKTQTYSEVAEKIGAPTAVRAVARACATNSIALAVPCHRVIGKNGSLTGYRWGVGRKRALQQAEKS
jgi:AraC family transcriptional regulator of adaptative response/methylated-DNA-[protein]-cysteine methyltransferase